LHRSETGRREMVGMFSFDPSSIIRTRGRGLYELVIRSRKVA